MRILLVEDEQLLSDAIAKGLRRRGYAVDAAYDGIEALEAHALNEYDLIILDLNLPGKDGMEVLREIRREDHDVRILILSARVQVADRVLGLDEGANDYLIKPFDFAELEARIRNLLRRSFSQRPQRISMGELALDDGTRQAFWGDVGISLTPKEYAILEYLLSKPGDVIAAEELLEHAWDENADPFSNVLRYHMHMLKKKLRDASGRDLIRTVRGQGYGIDPETVV